jgi:prepilin peptidase CpaA
MPSSPLVLAAVATGLGVAAVIDVKTRRVPNALTLTLAGAGIGSAALGFSDVNLRTSLAGLLLGLLLMLPGYLIGGTGAGDVKLFAAVGALIGPAPIVAAFFYTALAGGVLALLVAHRRHRLTATIDRTRQLILSRSTAVADIEHPQRNNRFAFVPAIAVGCLLAALGI